MIYIIEDDENIRNLVQVALNGSGYETAAFETAEEALGAFKVCLLYTSDAADE